MSGNGDSILIEILDGDPGAFGESPVSADGEPFEQRELPRWVRPVAIAVVLVAAGVAVLAWRPWHHEPEPPLSNRLVLDRPASALLNVSIDRQRPPDVTGDIGAVYAEDGATLPWLNEPNGRSLIWNAYAADSANAAYSDFPEGGRAVDDVQGATAAVWDTSDDVRLVFGPIGGRLFDVNSHGLTLDEVTSVAGAIGIEAGQPVLGGGDDALFDLLGLRLVGTSDELNTAMNLIMGDSHIPSSRATTHIMYADGAGGAVGVASVAEPEGGRTATLLAMLLGPSGAATIHGREAIATGAPGLYTSDTTPDNLIAWHEGGRLIVVTGSADLATLATLAEGTHEVAEELWAPIAKQAVDDDDRYLYWQSTIGYRRTADGLVIEVTAALYRPGAIDVCLAGQVATDCVNDSEMRLPFLKVVRIHTEAIVVAIVAAGSGESLLRLTHADGSADEHLLFAPGLQLPGPAVAVFLPDDLRSAELVIDGEVVATL